MKGRCIGILSSSCLISSSKSSVCKQASLGGTALIGAYQGKHQGKHQDGAGEWIVEHQRRSDAGQDESGSQLTMSTHYITGKDWPTAQAFAGKEAINSLRLDHLSTLAGLLFCLLLPVLFFQQALFLDMFEYDHVFSPLSL